MGSEFKKLASLQKLEQLNLNVHEYTVCTTITEVEKAVKEYNSCGSIRFDSTNNLTDLPFIMVERPLDLIKYTVIWSTLRDKDKIAIVSNGHRFDSSLLYNMVYKISPNGDFLYEFSTENVPLRHMYRSPKLLSRASGNIDQKFSDWERSGCRPIDLRVIREDLRRLHAIGIYDQYVECSKYSEPVGKLQQEFVFWQVQDKLKEVYLLR